MIEVPSLSSHWVQLRPITPGDYPFLYDLATSPEHGYRWRFRAGLPAYKYLLPARRAGWTSTN
jgi:hypothetical protein